jgi:hypothetical protein
MKLRALSLLAVLAASRALAADTADAVIVAAMRLSDEPSYRWVTTVADDARTYEIRGQTMKNGITHVKMPIVNEVRRRLGRSVTDTEIDVFFKGNVRCVLETEDGWKTLDELPPPVDSPTAEPPPILGILGGIPPPRPKLKNEEGYSNLQLAINHPHEELGVIVTSHTDLRFGDGTVTGTLSNLGAQLLLVHDGQHEITPLQANGTFKLWIRGGIVTRYQLQLDGVLAVGRKQIRVRQNSDTTLTDVGTTQFEVPSEARRKLGV